MDIFGVEKYHGYYVVVEQHVLFLKHISSLSSYPLSFSPLSFSGCILSGVPPLNSARGPGGAIDFETF